MPPLPNPPEDTIVLTFLCPFLLACPPRYWPLQFKPSLRAAAALHLARQTLNRPKHEVWNNALRHYTGYESRDLEPCVRQLLAVHSSAHLNPHFEVRRFGSTRRCRLGARARKNLLEGCWVFGSSHSLLLSIRHRW